MQQTENTGRPCATLKDKVGHLSDFRSYSHGATAVEVIETHMSWVFLAGDRVFKLKKPVQLPFLNFRTLARRRANVLDEIRLNRRLAPDVYLAARQLRQLPDGTLSINDSNGEIVDWLVEMRRLPESRTLESLITADGLSLTDIHQTADQLIGFYRGLATKKLSADVLILHYEMEHRKNSAVLLDLATDSDRSRITTALADFDGALDKARPLLHQRVNAGRIIEGHGDLRPEHVFLTNPPVIIDCLEFSKLLRILDPFEEIAFLGMECAHAGADWVFTALYDRLSNGLNDRPPPELASFYWRYRALLRARLSMAHLAEPVVRKPAKWRPQALRYIELAQQADIRTQLPQDR